MSYMRDGWQAPSTTIRVISSNGGLGDQIARLPAYKHMVDTYPHVEKLIVYVSDYFVVLAEFLLKHPRIEFRMMSKAPFVMPKPFILFDPERLTTLHLNLVDHAYLMLMDKLPPCSEDKEYLQAPHAPVQSRIDFSNSVIFTAAATAPARRWPAVHINGLARRLKAAGVSPVLMGSTDPINIGVEGDQIQGTFDEGLDRSLFVDLTNKTSLIEALGIMQRAKAVVGVDNGLLHLAACTETPIVFGLTSVNAKHRIPLRPTKSLANYCIGTNAPSLLEQTQKISVLEAEVPCNGCQNRGFAINTDWRTCLFDDYACTLTMTSSRFEAALKRLGVLP